MKCQIHPSRVLASIPITEFDTLWTYGRVYAIIGGYRVRVGNKTHRVARLARYICQICGRKATQAVIVFWPQPGVEVYHAWLTDDDLWTFNKDHIRPKSRGGSRNNLNLQFTCTKCNSEKALSL